MPIDDADYCFQESTFFGMEQLCESCHQWKRSPFIEVYPEAFADTRGPPVLQKVCGDCVVGYSVPAYRPALSKWHFGRVVGRDYPMFALFFDDVLRPEWVRLDSKPFEAYLDHHRRKRQTMTARLYESQYGSTGGMMVRDDGSSSVTTWDNPPSSSRVGWSQSHHLGATSQDRIWRPPSYLQPPISPLQTHESPKQQSGSRRVAEGRWGCGDIEAPLDHGSGAARSVQKCSPRLWTPEEDRILLQAVQRVQDMNNEHGGLTWTTIKWPDVAKLVPHRSGKQCRERFVNHLIPTVVSAGWTPMEDALICRLHRQVGSKWALMSKLLAGRSDNNVKNRFHHLRRQLEKQALFLQEHQSGAPDASAKELILKASQDRNAPDDLAATVADLMATMLTTRSRVLAPRDQWGTYFGPLEDPGSSTVSCKRCCLFIPSSQTGRAVCKKTGWCSSCVDTMFFASDDVLRVSHSLRASREQGKKRVSTASD